MPLKLIVDYYIGGVLHAILKPPAILLRKILRRSHDLAKCTNVTFIKMLGGGSLVIAYPALLAIKRQPNIRRLRLVTTPAIKPFGEALGIFDEIVVIRDRSLILLAVDSLAAIVRLFRCDAIVDLEVHSRLTTVFSLLTCARNRICFYTSMAFWRRGLATHLVFCNMANSIYFFYDQIAALFGGSAGSLEASTAVFRSTLALPAACPGPGSRIGLAPCCSALSSERMLLPQEWLKVLHRRFSHEGTGTEAEIHLLGGPSDREYLNQLAGLIRGEFPAVTAINHAGKTSLLESVRQLAGLDVLLCIDSGLLHFARLLGVPTVSFWGPTDPRVLLRPSPANRDEIHYHKLSCSPCVHFAQSPPCGGNNLCMRFAATPDLVGDNNPVWTIR